MNTKYTALTAATGLLGSVLAANYVTTTMGMVPVGFGLTATDGTYLTFGPTQNLPDVLAWTRLAGQGHLDLGAAA